MANYNNIQDIVSSIENATQLINNTKYDDNSYSITDVPEFVKYKGNAVTSIVASGNSWVGFNGSNEDLKVNRRDAAMYNLWIEQGYVKSLQFYRVRWSGYSAYNSTATSYLLTFDVIILSTGDIVLYIADIPKSSYNGVFSFAGTNYTKPTVDNRYVTFKIQEDNTYLIEYDCIVLDTVKYLIKSNDIIYTVVDNALVTVEGELNSNMFLVSGIDNIPDGELLRSLNNPEVMCWTDGVSLPTLKATVQGQTQGKHSIISNDINIGHSSIYGILSTEVVSSDNAKFYLSFDGGEWMIYNSISNVWEASTVGMTKTELVNILENAWSSVVNSAQIMKLKVELEGIETVTQVKFNFNNESPLE